MRSLQTMHGFIKDYAGLLGMDFFFVGDTFKKANLCRQAFASFSASQKLVCTRE